MSIRMIIFNHPDELKDKHVLRKNRQHVMHHYLEKERLNPYTTDHRITHTTKHKSNRTPRGPSAGLRSLSVINSKRIRRRDSASSSSSLHSSSSVSDHDSDFLKPGTSLSAISDAQKPIQPRNDQSIDEITQQAAGAQGSLPSRLQDPSIELPDPFTSIGSDLDAFGIWPSLSDPLLGVDQLEWGDTPRLGIHEMADQGPMNARHAFLSTLCISASHDDVMQRGLLAPHERLPHGSWERQRTRAEVIGLINAAMNDPKLQTADATIIAVLHVLNSEIMGGDDTQLKIHQEGLHQMVRSRGGVANLATDGQLPSVLTITMYMISALRESEPHPDFIEYAAHHGVQPPNDYSQLPESPVYCRPSGFYTTHRTLPADSPTASLLEDLRLLTDAFLQPTNQPHNEPCTDTITHFHRKISSLPPATTLTFPNHSAHHMYESLRLTAEVYAHALHAHIPLSRSAAILSLSHPARDFDSESTSWHMLIQSHLLQTPLSDLWSHATGTLFWIVLVAGACANPEGESGIAAGRGSDEEEEARKWLAAVAVRCSAVLSWRYGGCVLEMLKRVVAVQKRLRAGGREVDVDAGWEREDEEDEVGLFGGPMNEMDDFGAQFLDGL